MAKFIDTHVHFNDPAFDGDRSEAIGRSLAAGVYKMILADIDSRERPGMLATAAGYPGVLYTMLGLYPGSVGEDWEKEIGLMLDYDGPRPVAIAPLP